jgi:sporulation protein YlmC with PRC-barrel domain
MESGSVIRATELNGRAVVDLDLAEKVGKIDRLVLDPGARRVAAFLVSRSAPLKGEREHVTVPASAVHAIGPDALTIHRAQATDAAVIDRIESLPKESDLIGRKVISEGGRFLGKIDDVLIRREDGSIVGYTLGAHDLLKKIETLLRGGRKEREPYLRADAQLRTGKDLVVAPEDALSEEWGRPDETATVHMSHPDSERRGIEPGAPLAPGTSIRRAD